MLDHILVDIISAIRRSFDQALLQRQAVEERFQVDVFLGDVSWETSYSLPGEEQPPRVRADVSVDWPTWSQTSYRSWSIGEPPDELPEIVVEVALRVQRLAEAPDTDMVLRALPEANPLLGVDPLVLHRDDHRAGPCRRRRAVGRRGDVRGFGAFQRSATGGPGRDRARDRRPHAMDLFDPDPTGRPALFLPAPRRGGRLTQRNASGIADSV